jgi:hypothetical protein
MPPVKLSKPTRMVAFPFAIGVAALALTAATAFGFGTIHGLGQDAEHERITRHALACQRGAAPGSCFESKSLDMLAGKTGTVGAVGLPDVTMITSADAHCDMGDYLNVPGYPQSKADANAQLAKCRAWMAAKLDEAVRDAAALVDESGEIDDSQIPTMVSCSFGTGKGRAKCNVLEDFGVLLHASEDFYSHTNWTDRSDPKRPVGPDNPPGLGNSGPASWLNLRRPASAVPEGLISGCFKLLPESKFCNYGDDLHRVKHESLSKDKGKIDPKFGPASTSRGGVEGNFQRAVEAAIQDTRDKWATLSERLIATYGAERGRKMICAISHDKPAKDCD